jgi:plasmid stability protein
MINLQSMNTAIQMTSITIRNLDDSLKRRLRVRAAEHNRSMEEEARDILRCALAEAPAAKDNLADGIRRIIAPLGGVDLPSFPRGQLRDPPDFT